MRRHAVAIVLLTVVAVASAADAPKEPPVKEPELRAELLRRVKADRDARAAMTKWMKEPGNQLVFEKGSTDTARQAEFKKLADTLGSLDRENTERLGKIVERHGWPTHTLVGKDGAQAAWLLVQHADASPKFQRKCLDLMTKLPRDEVSQQNLAYLTDRVLLAEGKKQVYGTQFTLTDGKWTPRPLEDEANVDKRRAEVGLGPLREYVKELEAVYGGAKQ